MRNFRELQVWKDGMIIVDMIYELLASFPKSELYGLQSKLSRASISIPSNIAEGCSRSTDKDFKRYLEIALGSAFEVETHLLIAQKRKYISGEQLQQILAELHILQRRINAFRNTIKERL